MVTAEIDSTRGGPLQQDAEVVLKDKDMAFLPLLRIVAGKYLVGEGDSRSFVQSTWLSWLVY